MVVVGNLFSKSLPQASTNSLQRKVTSKIAEWNNPGFRFSREKVRQPFFSHSLAYLCGIFQSDDVCVLTRGVVVCSSHEENHFFCYCLVCR